MREARYRGQYSERKRCPICLTLVVLISVQHNDYSVPKEGLYVDAFMCPSCNHLLVYATPGQGPDPSKPVFLLVGEGFLVWPRHTTRPIAAEVPLHIAADYREAAVVLDLSPKSSAALSRRCLQALLREAAGATQHNLVQQITAVLPTLPSYIAQNVDAIRQIGNFAAHPMKDTASNQILDVEPGEAEWNLEVLDQLFDFYYVQPAVAQQKRDALNAKLQAANKPPMK